MAKVLAETDAAIFRCVPRKRCTSFSKLFTCKSLSKKLFAQILINLLFFCKICRTLFLRASFNAEAVARRCSIKKLFLEISQNLQENSCSRVSFLMKLQTEEVCNFVKKETLAQVFSCEFFKISKNTFSYRTPSVATSNGYFFLKFPSFSKSEHLRGYFSRGFLLLPINSVWESRTPN